MRDQPRTFQMFQKACAEARAFMRAFDQSRHIRHNKRATLAGRRIGIGGNHTEMRLQRRERIRGNFRPRRGDARNQSGFSSIRETDQPYIRQQFQFKAQVTFFAGLAVFMFARSLMPRPHEIRIAVAASAMSALGGQISLAGLASDQKAARWYLASKITVPTGTFRIRSSAGSAVSNSSLRHGRRARASNSRL